MPKINVYLPDDLAKAVKETGLSVSSICQQALEEAVLRVKTLRRAIAVIREPTFESVEHRTIERRLWEYMTKRLRNANLLVKETVGPLRAIETKDLLVGLIDEGENMAVRVLQSLGVDIDELRSAATREVTPEETLSVDTSTNRGNDGKAEVDNDAGDAMWRRLSQPARSAVASALEASVDLGHNYLGCEHLLFGFVQDAESGAGRVLNSFGIELGNLRRAVNGAVAGYNHRRDTAEAEDEKNLEKILRRLEVVEARLSTSSDIQTESTPI